MQTIFTKMCRFLLLVSSLFLIYKTWLYQTVPPITAIIADLIVFFFSLVGLLYCIMDHEGYADDAHAIRSRFQAIGVIVLFAHTTQILLLDDIIIGVMPINAFLQIVFWGCWLLFFFLGRKKGYYLNTSFIDSNAKAFFKHLLKNVGYFVILLIALLAYVLIAHRLITLPRPLSVSLSIVIISMATLIIQYLFFSYLARFDYFEKKEENLGYTRLVSHNTVLILSIPTLAFVILNPLKTWASYIYTHPNDVSTSLFEFVHQSQIYLLLSNYDWYIITLIGYYLLYKGFIKRFPDNHFFFKTLWIITLIVSLINLASFTLNLFAQPLALWLDSQTFYQLMRFNGYLSLGLTVMTISVQLILAFQLISKGYSISLWLLYRSLLGILVILMAGKLNILSIGSTMIVVDLVVSLLSAGFLITFLLQANKTILNSTLPEPSIT